MSRVSSRTPALSAKAVEAGILLGREESARKKTAEGFADFVQQRASEVEAAGGEESSGDDDVVAVEAPAATAAPLAKKPRKARKSKIWNPAFAILSRIRRRDMKDSPAPFKVGVL